jgi:hypothetical protein
MKKFFTRAAWLAAVCALLALILMATGMFWGDLGSHVVIANGDRTITLDGLAQQSLSVQLVAWAAIAFALFVVAVVVPVSLLFALAMVVLALVFTALLLAVPAVLLAAPVLLLVWWIGLRKHKSAAVSSTSAL